jgi:hypothetical protein
MRLLRWPFIVHGRFPWSDVFACSCGFQFVEKIVVRVQPVLQTRLIFEQRGLQSSDRGDDFLVLADAFLDAASATFDYLNNRAEMATQLVQFLPPDAGCTRVSPNWIGTADARCIRGQRWSRVQWR